MHCVYGALRISALVLDLFVFYHAKGLKILEDEDEEHEEEEEDMKLPETENHLVAVDQDDLNKPKHRRSLSREIRLIFDGDEKTEVTTDRRPSRHSDYAAEAISGISSTKVV